MRAKQARTALKAAIETHFNTGNGRDDVAQAFQLGDDGMYEALVRKLGRHCDTAEQVDAVIAAVAASIDDGLADWLTENAESPIGWLYGCATEHLDSGALARNPL
ncbi:hypothetical protein [Nonomuraea sp. NPDC023979]|uniref:hypothetical protein n=1 Tax=Nonomuraea sp. NPDC023979 TaxID=3154796 RepID=UPI0033E73C79